MYKYAELLGRILISFMFIQSGFEKITGYADTAAYMASQGVPALLLPLVILVELVGGLMVLLGFRARVAAFALAGFCILAALLFHYHPGDAMQMGMFKKNLAIAGGFLFVFANGAGALSFDRKWGKA
jgi:putative oxidoreductase